MRVAVLGPLEVRTDGSAAVEVQGAEERLLLAVLAAHAPEVVGTARLVELLSDAGAPEVTRESVQAHLGRLRRALEPGLPERSSGQYVLRRGTGYALAVARGDVDAVHFGDLVARGRARLAGGDPAEAVRFLEKALALWRGEAYCEWPDAAFADEERLRLAALRGEAVDALQRARALRADRPAVPLAVVAARRADPPEDRLPAPRVVLPEPEPPPDRVAPAGARDPDPAEADVLDSGPATRGSSDGHRSRWLVLGVVVALAVALLATRLTAASEREADRAATEAAADRLAALSADQVRLDVSVLLAAEAFRLADTPGTRSALRTVLTEHGRLERAVSFRGSAQGAVLSGGGRTLTFATGIGDRVVAWSMGPSTEPRMLMHIPAQWAPWTTAVGSPTEDVVMGAGGSGDRSWVRAVSAVDGRSRLLLGGDAIGGSPVNGAITPDGRRFLLLVAQPDETAPEQAARWRVLEVDTTDGTSRETGLSGTFPAPVAEVRTDFADDAGSFVLWGDDPRQVPARMVTVADGVQTPIPLPDQPSASTGFRAFPSGAARLEDDGSVTLVDRGGTIVQRLDAHTAAVRAAVVSPDGTWAATADGDGAVVRWDVDPATGLWSGPEQLEGHHGGVVGAQAHGDTQRLFTVSLDGMVIVWDMRATGGLDGERSGQRDFEAFSVWLQDACAVVGRDLTPGEWRRFLPDRPYRPTCTDLL